jgi:hypothetical protein
MADKAWDCMSSSKIMNSFKKVRLDSLKIMKVVRQLTSIILLKTAPKMIGRD